MPALPPSRRGQQNVKPDLMIDLSREVAQNAYKKTENPNGIIDLGSATNELMLEELQKWVKNHETAEDRKNFLRYNDTQHSPKLLAAAANFLNHFFHPRVPLTPNNLLAGNGLTALLDTLFFNLADEDSVILVPTPSYGMFFHDLATRNGLHVCPVPCDDITKARFRQHVRPGRPPPELFKRLSEAADAQRKLGRKIKGVLIANPENPLACCYSQGMLRWIVRWCEQEGVHLVVDEVYALSGGEAFNSVLSLDLGEMRENVHVLYGMAKDFGLGGCRVGFLATYNQQLHQTMRTCSMFTWVSSFGGITTTKLLSDTEYLERIFLPAYHAALDTRRSSLRDILDSNQIPYTDPDATFFIFVDLSQWLRHFEGANDAREMALLKYLMSHRVFLEPGLAFLSTLSGMFRLNYGGDEAEFKLGMQRLMGALKELDGEESKLASVEDEKKETSVWRRLSCFGSDT